MNKFILIIKNLSKSFHFQSRQLEVLKNLNFSIKKGELIALTGPSGSGKSTLLHLIALMEKPSTGKIFFTDNDGVESYLILCSRGYILKENAVKILQGQMLENQLLKLAEGLNLELRRTAEIQYMN